MNHFIFFVLHTLTLPHLYPHQLSSKKLHWFCQYSMNSQTSRTVCNYSTTMSSLWPFVLFKEPRLSNTHWCRAWVVVPLSVIWQSMYSNYTHQLLVVMCGWNIRLVCNVHYAHTHIHTLLPTGNSFHITVTIYTRIYMLAICI